MRAAVKRSGTRMVVASAVVGAVLGVGAFGVTQFAGADGPGPNGTVDAFVSLPLPSRILDTRFGVGAPAAPLGPDETLNVAAAVPADATAVVINITVEGPTASSYLTAWPTGTAPPTASNLNWVAGRTIANLATVKLGTNGQFSVYNYAGQVNVIIDVSGYYHPVSLDERYYTKSQVDALITAANNFNPNLYYQRSELYTRAESGRQFFAAVAANAVAVSSGGATVVRPSTGIYTVGFPSSLAGCVATATLAGTTPGSIAASVSGTSVNVRTWNTPQTANVTGNAGLTGTATGNVTIQPGTLTNNSATVLVPSVPGTFPVTGGTVTTPASSASLTLNGTAAVNINGTVDAPAAADRDFAVTVMCG